MANTSAQTLKGIGKDVQPHIAKPVTAHKGKHEENKAQRVPRLIHHADPFGDSPRQGSSLVLLSTW